MFTPRQKSQLIDVVVRQGMHEDYFQLVATDTSLHITYEPAKFYFNIALPSLSSQQPGLRRDLLDVEYHPGFADDFPDSDVAIFEQALDWKAVLGCHEKWVAWIKREFYEQTAHGQADLEEYREMAEMVAMSPPTALWLPGIPAPSLAHLHPTVQQAAGSRFASAHYADAISAACTALDKAVGAKAQRPDLNGKQLMDVAFTARNPLVRLSGNDNEQTGFMLLYQGVMQAIRNHYAHNLTEVPAARALEWLSFISALFYKLDEASTLPLSH